MTQVSISSYGLGQFGLAWIKSYLKNVLRGKKLSENTGHAVLFYCMGV